MMEPSQEIVELLREIRDLQRAHLAEYRKVSQEVLEQNRSSREQYQKSIDVGRSFTWVICLFIGLSLAANLLILARLPGTR